MDFNELERLIGNVAANPEVMKLIGEVEAIVEGKDSTTKLLAFLPIIAKILYEILDKDGKHESTFEMVETLIQIILGMVSKQKLVNK